VVIRPADHRVEAALNRYQKDYAYIMEDILFVLRDARVLRSAVYFPLRQIRLMNAQQIVSVQAEKSASELTRILRSVNQKSQAEAVVHCLAAVLMNVRADVLLMKFACSFPVEGIACLRVSQLEEVAKPRVQVVKSQTIAIIAPIITIVAVHPLLLLICAMVEEDNVNLMILPLRVP